MCVYKRTCSAICLKPLNDFWIRNFLYLTWDLGLTTFY